MRRPASVLIVGAGLAGARCAEALRAGGFGGRVVMAGEEPHAPYERPALSKEVLLGQRSAAELRLRPPAFWAEREIELRLGARVDRVDLRTREAYLAGGGAIAWQALVLATGARARSLPGPALPRGAYVLRSLRDSLALRRALCPGVRLAIVGAGFVGTEVASAAVKLGVEVALVDPAPVPMARALGEEVGELLRDRYRAEGVALQLGTPVCGFGCDRRGLVRSVALSDGTEVRCDAVLVAIGAQPDDGLIDGALAGIATDAAGRTKHPGVYACGDVAAMWRPSRRAHVRVEHWTAAARHGVAVARAILGQPDAAAEEPPFFWSDQFGLRLQYVGDAVGHATVEIDGSPEAFRADYLDREGRLLAALAVNRPHEVGALRRALAA